MTTLVNNKEIKRTILPASEVMTKKQLAISTEYMLKIIGAIDSLELLIGSYKDELTLKGKFKFKAKKTINELEPLLKSIVGDNDSDLTFEKASEFSEILDLLNDSLNMIFNKADIDTISKIACVTSLIELLFLEYKTWLKKQGDYQYDRSEIIRKIIFNAKELVVEKSDIRFNNEYPFEDVLTFMYESITNIYSECVCIEGKKDKQDIIRELHKSTLDVYRALQLSDKPIKNKELGMRCGKSEKLATSYAGAHMNKLLKLGLAVKVGHGLYQAV